MPHPELEQDGLAELQVAPEHVVGVRERQVVVHARQESGELGGLHLMGVGQPEAGLLRHGERHPQPRRQRPVAGGGHHHPAERVSVRRVIDRGIRIPGGIAGDEPRGAGEQRLGIVVVVSHAQLEHHVAQIEPVGREQAVLHRVHHVGVHEDHALERAAPVRQVRLLRVAPQGEPVVAVRLPVHHQPPDVARLREQRGGGTHPGRKERAGLQPVGVQTTRLGVVQIGAVQKWDRLAGGVVRPNVADHLIRDREREPPEPRKLERVELDAHLGIARRVIRRRVERAGNRPVPRPR